MINTNDVSRHDDKASVVFSGFQITYFTLGLFCLCIAYCIFEYWFIPYGALSSDEFVFARHIYEYTRLVPYHDFPPYKTVLGYYLLSIPLFFSKNQLASLFYIKAEIACINIICIACTAMIARHFFNKTAIMISLLAVLANQLFLVYSVDLRVDMLTAWCCLFATFAVMANHFKWAGVLLGIAFLISQKALWYLIAIDASLLISLCALSFSTYTIRSFFAFNLSVIAIITFYIVCWSTIASPFEVLYSLFYEAYIQAKIDLYESIYLLCWQRTLSHGPLLFLILPLCLLIAFDKTKDAAILTQRVFIMLFSFIVFFQFIQYKQAFPYNFVMVVPALFLIYCESISWFLQKNVALSVVRLENMSFLLFVIAYFFCISIIIYFLLLPPWYFFILLLPLSILFYLSLVEARDYLFKRACFVIIIMLFLLFGIALPLKESYRIARLLDGSYQKTILQLADAITQDGEYIGGIPFLYWKDQPINGMKNLIEPALRFLFSPDEKYQTLLLPSLYLTPATTKQILDDFSKKPIKVLINNYRMCNLPDDIQHYVQNNYKHFYGSLYVYAPVVHASNKRHFNIKFTGHYRIETAASNKVLIDRKPYHAHQFIHLTSGQHDIGSPGDFRLVLVPPTDHALSAKYAKDNWIAMIKAIVT